MIKAFLWHKAKWCFALLLLTSCGTSRISLENPEQGSPLLCIEGGCVQLFGDYQDAPLNALLPPADLKSFKTLPKKSILGTYSTFIEPHFSCALIKHENAIDTLSYRLWLEQLGAQIVETHYIENADQNLTVANYTVLSKQFHANCYFRELAFERAGHGYRMVFWTFDHPQNLKTETIRIFDTYAVN